MQSKSVTIINTGCANIASVKFALSRLGAHVTVTQDLAEIRRAPRLLLPGVGAAPAAMRSIRDRELILTIQQLTQPVLGVCLGMQLMVESSQENDLGVTQNTPCLGLMAGEVKRLMVDKLRLPHMGWNEVTTTADNQLFAGIDSGSFFYFVHSFAVPEYHHTIALCEYGQRFSAAIQHNNFFGVQFHPERSSDAGAQLLKNFMQL